MKVSHKMSSVKIIDIKAISEPQCWEDAEAYLFLGKEIKRPSENFINYLLDQKIDVWHSGLNSGVRGLPGAIDFVQPIWMLNRDADPAIESTSWRISPHACLIRADVIKKMGWLAPGFKTAEAAFLEMGHRWIANGVMMRNVPGLLGQGWKAEDQRVRLPFEDELRFIYYRFGNKWAKWTMVRAILSRYAPMSEMLSAWGTVKNGDYPYRDINPYEHGKERERLKAEGEKQSIEQQPKVSVLIPTLHRYPYLRTVLDQLRQQTVKPLEIIIVDQSRKELRDIKIAEDFKDLPIKMIYQDNPGQCTSRNAGLKISQGTHVLFIDDDDEVTPTLIEAHLKNMSHHQCEVSSGIANEVGIPDLPKNFKFLRQSDVFPTNNTMIKKEVLKRSGLFDLAYNRKQRADGDLGMRVYLSGAQMILNPDISVLHHHAAEGGLRQYKARKVTYAVSRQSLWIRHLPSDSEIYLGLRYFSEKQVREFLWHKVMGTFSVKGNIFERLIKVIVSLIYLPHTMIEIKKCCQSAKEMLEISPRF